MIKKDYITANNQLPTDKELIDLVKADKDQFALIYEKHFINIFRFIYNRVETVHIADDLTSQVFYKALMNISKFKYTGAPIITWLYRIARNEINLEFRNNKYTKVLNVKTEALKEVIEEDIHDKELWDRLMKLVAKLEYEEIELIEMKYFEGMSYELMSQILNTGESALKMKIYRIKNKLKEFNKIYIHD